MGQGQEVPAFQEVPECKGTQLSQGYKQFPWHLKRDLVDFLGSALQE